LRMIAGNPNIEVPMAARSIINSTSKMTAQTLIQSFCAAVRGITAREG
jgi:hypothetical protein